ncbi:Protein N-acetyltransferase, RimJ/RimL family [Actinomadura meyerae]|uniref:Protein N-acetyltransferase, RimJ/RimL family n=1 Tax=Actinomadura meyerae TaxID=240840 RepID=A0A239LYI2_9ACTN|nr:GNAT family N-acetyltransferase [Actinomadura meyerae]SNT35576.1 Protein N-acetyltransferase, RimJ/RimL family [Actinomadura meyerae]
MLVDHFPLLGLRLRTPRLELRLPSPEELGALADAAVEGVHAPDTMPFAVPWTDRPPADIARGVVQHHWETLGRWSPGDWQLNLSVFHAGEVVGQQDLRARDLAVLRQVQSGSWLGMRHQGQGIGTEMRAAVLHLAFAGLGAEEALSTAFEDNHASRAVSRKLGYAENGIGRQVVRGVATTEHHVRLTRADWEKHATVPVTIEGLAPCLPMFGVPEPTTP